MTDTLTAASTDIETASGEFIAVHASLASAADRTLNPRRWLLRPDHGTVPFQNRDDALTWLDTSVSSLRGAIHVAYGTDRHEQAVHLCESLWSWLALRKAFDVWEDTHTIGLASARKLGDPAAEARMLSGLGACRTWQDDDNEAETLHLRERAQWHQAQHAQGIASNLESLGVLALKKGHPEKAEGLFRDARERFAELGSERGVMIMTRHLAEAHRDMGNDVEATKQFNTALAWFRDDEDQYMVVRTFHELARLHFIAARIADALAAIREALPIARGIGAVRETTDLQRLATDIDTTTATPTSVAA